MSNLRLQLSEPRRAIAPPIRQPLGRHLVNEGFIDQQDLIHALELQCHVDAPLGEVMISEGLITRADMLRALALQHGAQLVDLSIDPPDPDLANKLPTSICMAHRVVPWMQIGDTLLVATSRPDRFQHLRDAMGPEGPTLLPVIVDRIQIHEHLTQLYGQELAHNASTRVPAAQSCRAAHINTSTRQRWAGVTILLLVMAMVFSPLWTLTILMLWAFVTLIMSTALKMAAFWSQISNNLAEKTEPAFTPVVPFRLPQVSIMVPLLKEKEIAGALIKRLSRLTYPKSLLNVVLVLEQNDTITRETIARTELPDWISVIEVPEGDKLTTKPRAMNYALDFCRGSIIGVWDAEDAPEPDQIEKVVRRFQEAPRNVACLQGILDYYNSRTNWLSRCFTIEYATWWRVVLPGVARLGLVIPLGGTTLFFRREILEELGGWDAHNVTEDADLGIRLARYGYVTELLPTVTYEEANCRAWPWVRQRSRWLKGYLITWCVHMRDPRALLNDLGLLRFLGVQTMLLATFSQFALAPLLWSFWITLFGVTHPVALTMGEPVMWAMVITFIFAELVNMAIMITAVSGNQHRHLIAWVLTTPFYFAMGVLAAFKALQEFVLRPFFWDKTQHGIAPEIIEQPSPLSKLGHIYAKVRSTHHQMH